MKSLQEWYRQVNGIYLDRNFYRSVESIFSHLVEVCRGLSAAASTRRKRDLKHEEFLPKVLAWWLALCGRAGVPDIEELLWAKFPGVCPYCQLPRHRGNVCKEGDPAHATIRWQELEKIASENGRRGLRPKTLAEWQQLFNAVYPRDEDTDHENNVTRLSEELGELAEAVRALPLAPEYFVSEAPDVFAWVMGFSNQFDFDRRVPQAEFGLALARAMEDQYPGYCFLCKQVVCKCPPIPASTLGRIAREAPLAITGSNRLFSLPESIQLFRRSEQSVTVAGNVVPTDASEIGMMREDIARILEALSFQKELQPRIAIQLASAVGSIERLMEHGEVTQALVDEVLAKLTAVPGDQRNQAVAFLNNLAASATFTAILRLLGQGG